MKQIYLDNSATTRPSEAVMKKYTEVALSHFGNPSSLHSLGFEAEKILNGARNEIRLSLGQNDAEVIFTASGSEANNLAILGRAFAKQRFSGGKILTTMGEHASVDEPLSALGKAGFRVVKIPTAGGVIDLEALERELTPDTFLVTMMLINNETGALYDIPSVSRLMRSKSPSAVLHVDATQGYMKLPFTLSSLGADMITLSSHKIEGPKGVGALATARSVVKSGGIRPLILGGGQEGGLRSGTENVPAIAGFGEAVRIGRGELRARSERMKSLRDYLIDRLRSLPEISPTLVPVSAPHILNITLPSIKSETMLHYLSSLGIFVSSGSACSSNTGHISSALIAYGRSAEEADSSIRISLSHENTKEEIDALVEALGAGLMRLSRKR